MDDHVARYAQLIDRFVAWANTREDIVAAMIVGSRARADHPADEWSDLDAVIFATEPARLLDDDLWLASMGEPLITFREPTAVGIWEERRVLFRNGCDADFSVIPASYIDVLAQVTPGDPQHGEVANVVGRGYRVLIDKAETLAPLLARLSTERRIRPVPPTQAAFDQIRNDFWYHCVWTVKKLGRGELMVAHECLDGNQRHLLMQMSRWLAEWDGAVWHGTRYMEEWAPTHVLESLPATWSLHTREDILRALTAMMDLVSFLTREIGAAYGLEVSDDEEAAARHWLHGISDA
jgi:aminoglycoside 6-adenylyltransferase